MDNVANPPDGSRLLVDLADLLRSEVDGWSEALSLAEVKAVSKALGATIVAQSPPDLTGAGTLMVRPERVRMRLMPWARTRMPPLAKGA